MKSVSNNNISQPRRPVINILTLAFFLAGVALSAAWFSRSHAPAAAAAVANPDLSDATKAVLQHLDTTVEIHFYSILDTSSVPDAVQAFAGRVDQLISLYRRRGGRPDQGGSLHRPVRCHRPGCASRRDRGVQQ